MNTNNIMLSTDEEIRPEGKEALNRLYKNNKNLSLDDKINILKERFYSDFTYCFFDGDASLTPDKAKERIVANLEFDYLVKEGLAAVVEL